MEISHHSPYGGRRHRIAMVCDFFYPSMGGVENHIYQLAQCLISLGHKVIVVTHRYNNRVGVRYMTGGLKVYHLPLKDVHDRCVLPTGLLGMPILRDVLIRESITIVHAHAVCTMALEAVFYASILGYHTCYTEHSNFGFSTADDINLNKTEKVVLTAATNVIVVSYTTRENICLRAKLDPSKVFVIPNAVDVTQFQPNPDNIFPTDTVNIVIMTRLVWRKGTHLLVEVIPEICKQFPYVHIIVGGDGPKKLELEEMRERYHLQDRVEMLGSVQHSDVPKVLTRGHIFLNTSLTEAFCIAILEAVSCGLVVVSTKVGGVPEILPKHMLCFAAPEPPALIEALCQAIPFARKNQSSHFHTELRSMYSWMRVAERTVKVYNHMAIQEHPSLYEKFRRFNGVGPIAGKIAVALTIMQYLFLALLKWLIPEPTIEKVPDFPFEEYGREKSKWEPLPITSEARECILKRKKFIMNG